MVLYHRLRKKFYQVILEALETGPMTREELKILYRAENIGVEEEKQVFNAWGGVSFVIWLNEEKFTRSMG